MPPARSASARTSTARAAATAERRRERTQRARRPQRVTLRSPHLRVRWERVGRIGLLVVLAIVIGLYAQHTISYFGARAQSNRQRAIVDRLKAQNAYYQQRERSLSDLSTILVQARKLGMVRPGEQPYAITGQPSR
jgi:cell division protein FtsB